MYITYIAVIQTLLKFIRKQNSKGKSIVSLYCNMLCLIFGALILYVLLIPGAAKLIIIS